MGDLSGLLGLIFLFFFFFLIKDPLVGLSISVKKIYNFLIKCNNSIHMFTLLAKGKVEELVTIMKNYMLIICISSHLDSLRIIQIDWIM